MKDERTKETMWNTKEFLRHGSMVLELLARFVEDSRKGEKPVVRLQNVEQLCSEMNTFQVLEKQGEAQLGLQSLVQSFLDSATRLHHPAYMAHQVALPHYASALADLISGVLNNGMSVYEMGPTAGAIEVAIIDWMLAHVGWQPSRRHKRHSPPTEGTCGGGVLTHGGSLANLTALLAARAKCDATIWERGTPNRLVLIAPESAHYSLSRAAAILGLGTRAIVQSPTDTFGRLLPDELRRTVRDVQTEGYQIMAVCANACATATGLYDPLAEIGAFCRSQGLWFHVDGAHGASALLHPKEAHRLAGVELADSLVWDAHKLMQTSALCAAVLVRDGATLNHTFQQQAVYVTEGEREIGTDFIPIQFECTKSPLGLKLFLTLAVIGEAGLAENIERLWSSTRRFAEQIANRPHFEILCQPESNILCFRRDGSDALQTELRNALMKRGDFLLSQADVAGRRWLRLTLMNPLTDESTIERLLNTIDELLQQGHHRP